MDAQDTPALDLLWSSLSLLPVMFQTNVGEEYGMEPYGTVFADVISQAIFRRCL